MKKHLFLFSIIVLSNLLFAQDPEISAWKLNKTGHTANYEYYQGAPQQGATAVQLTDSSGVKSVYYNDTDVFIRTNNLASYTMGPFLANPNVPVSQDYTFNITRTPTEKEGVKTATPWGGVIGVAVNGVVFFGYGDARSYNNDGIWDSDAWVSEGETMDASGGGHPAGTGTYHYHATPFTLYAEDDTEHSPIVGYALDGFPIYGPFAYSSPLDPSSACSRMTSGYELRNITTRTTLPDGTTSNPSGPDVSTTYPIGTYIQDYEYTGNGDLDEFNGRFCVTPEYPEGTYAYFLTTNSAGEPAFPYILAAEYYGDITRQEANQAGSSIVPSGAMVYDEILTSTNNISDVEISVFPNPTTEKVVIRTKQVADEIILFSSEGKFLERWSPSSENFELNVSNYPSGLYLLRAVIKNELLTRTLQIVR